MCFGVWERALAAEWYWYSGTNTYAGIPASFLLEEILRYDIDLDQVRGGGSSALLLCL